LQGKCSRITNKEIYQKEPINVTLFTGMHKRNDNTNDILGKGTNSVMVNIQMDYGNPFETRFRNLMIFLKLRADLDFGVEENMLIT